jgi:hypothetical protein
MCRQAIHCFEVEVELDQGFGVDNTPMQRLGRDAVSICQYPEYRSYPRLSNGL